MKFSLTIILLLLHLVTFGQNSDDDLINQALKLFCEEELVMSCVELDDKKKDTIYFYSDSFKPTQIIKVSRRLYYKILDNLDESERMSNCIIDVREMFNESRILMLSFKILKTPKTFNIDKVGLVRCQIIDGQKISFVDARFE